MGSRPSAHEVHSAFVGELRAGGACPSADDDLAAAIASRQERVLRLTGRRDPLVALDAGDVAVRPSAEAYPYRACTCSSTVTVHGPLGDVERAVLVTGVVDVCEGARDADLEERAVTCPNCGAPSRVGELGRGCAYCGTRYEVSDLFPRVFGLAVLSDPGRVAAHRYALPCLVGAVALALLAPAAARLLPLPLVVLVVVGLVAAGLAFLAAGRQAVAGAGRMARDFSAVVPGFQYEYVMADLVSALWQAVFSENPGTCPTLACEPAVDFSDVVSARFERKGAYKGMRRREGVCEVDMELRFKVARIGASGALSEAEEAYAATFARATDGLYAPTFSAHAVECAGCSASFDAFATRECPYCGRMYEPARDRWTVTALAMEGKAA